MSNVKGGHGKVHHVFVCRLISSMNCLLHQPFVFLMYVLLFIAVRLLCVCVCDNYGAEKNKLVSGTGRE